MLIGSTLEFKVIYNIFVTVSNSHSKLLLIKINFK